MTPVLITNLARLKTARMSQSQKQAVIANICAFNDCTSQQLVAYVLQSNNRTAIRVLQQLIAAR